MENRENPRPRWQGALAWSAAQAASAAAAIAIATASGYALVITLVLLQLAAFLGTARLLPRDSRSPVVWGRALLPSGFLAAYWVSGGSLRHFVPAALVLGAADACACAVGSTAVAAAKTPRGSAAFFLATLATLLLAAPGLAPAAALAAAFTLMLVESLSTAGTDNLTVGAAAALLLRWPPQAEWIPYLSLTLPLFLSAIVGVVVLRLRLLRPLARPLDHGFTLRGRRIFGDNKTYRVPVVAVVGCLAISLVLHRAHGWLGKGWISPLFEDSPILVGLLIAVPYNVGELLNSFIKRQLDIAPGARASSRLEAVQAAFDLVDGVLLVAVALAAFTELTWRAAVMLVPAAVGLHHAIELMAQAVGLRRLREAGPRGREPATQASRSPARH